MLLLKVINRGKEFTVTVSDCALQGTGDVLNQLHIDFRALSGVMAAGSGKYLLMKLQPGLKMSGSYSFPFRTRPIYSMFLVQREILVQCIQ